MLNGRKSTRSSQLGSFSLIRLTKMSSRLFVANLSSRIRSRDLKNEFGKYGKIYKVTIKEGRDIYAFVEFDSRSDAENAISRLDGKEIYGRRIRVEFSKSNRSRESAGRCYICTETGHWAKECPNGNGYSVADGRCFSCGERGHNAKDCRGRKSRSRSYSSRRRSRSPRRHERRDDRSSSGRRSPS